MRKTCEIIADLKDGIDVPYEELKMACLVQSALIFFYQQDTKSLLKGGIEADLVKTMEYQDSQTSSLEQGIPSWYWNAVKKDPYEWLSPRNIPGTDEWQKWHTLGKKLLAKAMKSVNEKN